MIHSNKHIMCLTIRNVRRGKTVSFTYYYVRERDIRMDYPCCTRSLNLTLPHQRPVHVMQSRFAFSTSCPLHS